MAVASRRHLRARGVALRHAQFRSTSIPSATLGPIWQYWAQGVDKAPPIVKACLRSVERHRGNRELVVLDDSTLERYLDLPGHVWDKRGTMGVVHFSDFIRLSLLLHHGGTWLDATILLREPMPAEVEKEDFYLLRQTGRPRLLEPWFIHAHQGHPLIETVLVDMSDYWAHHDRLAHYFLICYLFEAALLLHGDLRRQFLAMPQVNVKVAHALRISLLEPFEEAWHGTVYARSWLHKLSHKYARPDDAQNLLCDRIIDGWPER